MKIDYPAKVLLAWSEAIKGNPEIRDWLMKNGYPELGLFSFALRNNDEAREWLIKNNFPHLMALIRGCEGDPNAILWLRKFKLDTLVYVARAADNSEEAMTYLVSNNHLELARVAAQMRFVKNTIERDNNDVHKISRD